MTVSTTALRSEIDTDPAGLGYAAAIAAAVAQHQQEDPSAPDSERQNVGSAAVEAILNDASRARPVATTSVAGTQLSVAVSPLELVAHPLDPNVMWFLQNLMQSASTTPLNPQDKHFAELRDTIFAPSTYPSSNAALVALGTHPGSRAEELWGAGTVVDLADVQAARAGA